MSNLDLPSSSEGPLINWQYLLMMAQRHYRLFLAVFIPVVGLTVAYLLITKPLYESTAVVQVEQQVHSDIQVNPTTSADDLTSDDAVKTIEQNMQSYDLFEAVVKDPDVINDPDFLVGFPGSDATPSPADLADWLRSNTFIELRHGTRLIDVTVYHRVPHMAQKLAEALVETYVSLGGETQSTQNQKAAQLLDTESASVKQKLQGAEQALDTYKDLLDLQTRIVAQQSAIDTLKERYREKHPQMIEARALMAEINQEFDSEFQKTVNNPVNKAVAPLDPALASSSLDDRVTAEIGYVQARAQVLQKEVDTDSDLFNNLLKQREDAMVSQDANATAIKLAEPPQLPDKPAKPKKIIILLLGISMGTFLGLGAVVGVRAIDSTIDTPDGSRGRARPARHWHHPARQRQEAKPQPACAIAHTNG